MSDFQNAKIELAILKERPAYSETKTHECLIRESRKANIVQCRITSADTDNQETCDECACVWRACTECAELGTVETQEGMVNRKGLCNTHARQTLDVRKTNRRRVRMKQTVETISVPNLSASESEVSNSVSAVELLKKVSATLAVLREEVPLNISEIIPFIKDEESPGQPRKEFDEDKLRELAVSLKIGQYIPIDVCPIPQHLKAKYPGKRWMIIIGERRWRAAEIAKKETIRGRVYDVDDWKVCYLIASGESGNRENLTVEEMALDVVTLRDQFGLTIDQVAELKGVSRSWVKQRYASKWVPEKVRRMLSPRDGRKPLSIQAIEILAGYRSDPNFQIAIANEIVTKGIPYERLNWYIKKRAREFGKVSVARQHYAKRHEFNLKEIVLHFIIATSARLDRIDKEGSDLLLEAFKTTHKRQEVTEKLQELNDRINQLIGLIGKGVQ